MGKKFETTIEIGGKISPSVVDAIQNAIDSVGKLSDEMMESASAAAKLSASMDKQEAAIKAAQEQYASYVLNGEKGSKAAKALAKSIQKMDKDLSSNKTAMREAEEAAERLAPSLRDTGKAAEDSSDGFTVMKGAMSDLVADGISGLIDAAGNAVQSIWGISESTREYREDMGKLETAFETAGKSTDLATETYKNFYSVLGEEDRSVEAVNHLAKLVDSEQDMQKWTDICAGVWGTFGDSLPIEGLTEAANETMRTGKLTGPLTDALNWAADAGETFGVTMKENTWANKEWNKRVKEATTAEEYFQLALEQCSTEQERQQLIQDTLNGLYGEAAEKYYENNESIIDARKATSDYTDSMAELGEKMEPLTTAIQGELNEALGLLIDKFDDVDLEPLIEKAGNLTETCITLATDGLAWVNDNAGWLIPMLSGVAGAFAAFEIISGVMSLISGFSTALTFLSGPIGIAVAAIGAVTGMVVLLYQNWDTAKVKVEEFGAKVGEIWDGIAAWIGGAIDTIGQYFPLFGAYLEGWWSSIQDAVEHVKNIFHEVIDFISNVFAGNWSDAWDNVVSIFGNILGGLVDLIKAPLNGVISLVNRAIRAINGISVEIPDWLPGGGGYIGFDIPTIPKLATGGFTDGVSIAGEAGTEAVISFDPRYKMQNLSYWAKAGRMLGADIDDFALGGDGSGDTIDFGGVTFAPNITITGNADKNDVLEAIREAEPEFMDMLEELINRRRRPVYV